MAKRKQRPSRQKSPTAEYKDAEGNVLVLRQELSAGTVAKLREGHSTAATSLEDDWHRRQEALFERLAVSWEISDLPLTDQKMLLGRYRMADSTTQQWVRETMAKHLERYMPELAG